MKFAKSIAKALWVVGLFSDLAARGVEAQVSGETEGGQMIGRLSLGGRNG